MASITKEIFRQFFKDDGELRDIYITGTSKYDWNRLWDYILNNPTSILVVDGEDLDELPHAIHGLFEELYNKHFYLYITYQDIRFALHFIRMSEIEFDVSPREINQIDKLKAVLNFMKKLAHLLSKNVSLSMENKHDQPWLTITPTNKFIAHHKGASSISIRKSN